MLQSARVVLKSSHPSWYPSRAEQWMFRLATRLGLNPCRPLPRLTAGFANYMGALHSCPAAPRIPIVPLANFSSLVVHGPNGVPTATSEYEHSSIPATVKNIFNLPSFLTKRDAWAGSFHSIVQTRKEPRTDCPVQLPTPVRIRETEANEDAQLTEFQQELMQLASVLKGDDIFTNLREKIRKMTVKEGNQYMEDAVKSFFEAGIAAKKMGGDEEQIVKMRPSLTTRPSKP